MAGESNLKIRRPLDLGAGMVGSAAAAHALVGVLRCEGRNSNLNPVNPKKQSCHRRRVQPEDPAAAGPGGGHGGLGGGGARAGGRAALRAAQPQPALLRRPLHLPRARRSGAILLPLLISARQRHPIWDACVSCIFR